MDENIRQVLIDSTMGISTYKEGMTNLVVNIDEVVKGIKKLMIDSHDHNWQLGKYTEATVHFIDQNSSIRTPASAEFVCECGTFKTVEDKGEGE